MKTSREQRKIQWENKLNRASRELDRLDNELSNPRLDEQGRKRLQKLHDQHSRDYRKYRKQLEEANK